MQRWIHKIRNHAWWKDLACLFLIAWLAWLPQIRDAHVVWGAIWSQAEKVILVYGVLQLPYLIMLVLYILGDTMNYGRLSVLTVVSMAIAVGDMLRRHFRVWIMPVMVIEVITALIAFGMLAWVRRNRADPGMRRDVNSMIYAVYSVLFGVFQWVFVLLVLFSIISVPVWGVESSSGQGAGMDFYVLVPLVLHAVLMLVLRKKLHGAAFLFPGILKGWAVIFLQGVFGINILAILLDEPPGWQKVISYPWCVWLDVGSDARGFLILAWAMCWIVITVMELSIGVSQLRAAQVHVVRP